MLHSEIEAAKSNWFRVKHVMRCYPPRDTSLKGYSCSLRDVKKLKQSEFLFWNVFHFASIEHHSPFLTLLGTFFFCQLGHPLMNTAAVHIPILERFTRRHAGEAAFLFLNRWFPGVKLLGSANSLKSICCLVATSAYSGQGHPLV